MRRVITGQNLDGRTLDASLFQGGHGQQSYIGSCSINGAVFLGDWRGSDFVNNTGAADWSGAQVYACRWQNSVAAGALFPPNIGWTNEEPLREILRAAGTTAPRRRLIAALQPILESASRHDDLQRIWARLKAAELDDDAIALMRSIVTAYPGLRTLVQSVVVRAIDPTKGDPPANPVYTIGWPAEWNEADPDFAVDVNIDSSALPVTRPFDRYQVKTWLEQQAGPEHYAWVWSLDPFVAEPMAYPDYWLNTPRGGF